MDFTNGFFARPSVTASHNLPPAENQPSSSLADVRTQFRSAQNIPLFRAPPPPSSSVAAHDPSSSDQYSDFDFDFDLDVFDDPHLHSQVFTPADHIRSLDREHHNPLVPQLQQRRPPLNRQELQYLARTGNRPFTTDSVTHRAFPPHQSPHLFNPVHLPESVRARNLLIDALSPASQEQIHLNRLDIPRRYQLQQGSPSLFSALITPSIDLSFPLTSSSSSSYAPESNSQAISSHEMPPQTRRKRTAAALDGGDSENSDRPLAHTSTPAKRRRTTQQTRASSQIADETSSSVEAIDLADLDGGADAIAIAAAVRGSLQTDQILSQLNPTNGNEATPPRLSTLTCVICLEPPRNLTTTLCGHLFCHTCLMEALIAGEHGASASRCPVCRTAVLRTDSGKTQGGEGYHWTGLELKVVKRKGMIHDVAIAVIEPGTGKGKGKGKGKGEGKDMGKENGEVEPIEI